MAQHHAPLTKPDRDRAPARSSARGHARQIAATPPGSSALRLGNLAFAHLLQTKLSVSHPQDAYEREADRVADEVMRMPEPMVSAQLASRQVQRVCAECEAEVTRQAMRDEGPRSMEPERIVARGATGGAGLATEVDQETEHRIDAMRGGGQPLPQEVRGYMEPRFGYNFDPVRVHTDAAAAQTARELSAQAFTVGQDIVFAAGKYAPHTEDGLRLVAHELTHVIQQGAAGRALQAQPDDVPQGGARSAPVPMVQRECTPPYDPSYGPSSTHCSAYQSGLAKSFLTWTYRHNATCACENTPDDPKNNCIRKCLQVKMNTFLSGLSSSGAAIGTCLDPIGLLDFTCPEPYCSELHDHHLECYRECCCENEFIGYPAFWFMCEAPYPCWLVSFTIRKFNSCD